MAKISKIRFINFTYNENRHIYDQTFDFFNGEDTLLNLQNGGGKTVLVQMMMQPVIPKQKLKDRLFKSYFSNLKAPAYIMIEWIPDNLSKKVMTGIGIRRVSGKSQEEESENLKIITFISEYETSSPFDIKNIDLLEKEKGLIKLIDFEKVIKNISAYEKEGMPIWLYKWDIADEKKEYATRLSLYQINQLEWKNLMVKINEAEAGLNSFFNDCKTSSSLIKKWFIPTIEEQLSTSGSFVENIKELIKNHAVHLVKNEEMLNEREIFEGFKAKSVPLIKEMKEYADIASKIGDTSERLGNSYLFAEKKANEYETLKNEISLQINNHKEKIKSLEYEKLSSEYHDSFSALTELIEKVNYTEEKILASSRELNDFEHKKNLFACARLRDEIRSLNGKIAKYEAELEKEKLEQDDIKGIINDLEYSLKLKFSKNVEELENESKRVTDSLRLEKNKLEAVLLTIESLKIKIKETNELILSAQAKIAVFEENESTLKKLYPDFQPVKNIYTGQYDEESLILIKNKLEEEKSDINNQIEFIKEQQAENQKAAYKLEKEGRKLQEEYPKLIIEKNKHEEALNKYKNEKTAVDKIVKELDLPPDSCFDREKLLLVISSEKEKYEKLISDKKLENITLSKQSDLYRSGRIFEIASGLKDKFAENNIFAEFGYEWLENLVDIKAVKIKIVKSNPFLPYSLIVSKTDLETIKAMVFKMLLPVVVPILEKEKMEQQLETISCNNLHCLGGVHFLIPFDDRILSKNYLKEIDNDINNTINKNNDVIKTANEALRNTISTIYTIENSVFTKETESILSGSLDIINEKIKENLTILENTDKNVNSLQNQKSELFAILNNTENKKNQFLRKESDILGFINRLTEFKENFDIKEKNVNFLYNINDSLRETEIQTEKSKYKINEENIRSNNLQSLLEKSRHNLVKYQHVFQGNYVDEDIDSLESKLKGYTSEISGKIQSLNDILNDYRFQSAEKQKVINSFNIDVQEYDKIIYGKFEEETLETKVSQAKKDVFLLNEEKNKLNIKLAEKNAEIRYMKKNILERCGYDNPLEKEYIRDINFEKEALLQKSMIKEAESKLSFANSEKSSVQNIQYTLEEYKDFASKVSVIQPIEGNLNIFVLSLIKEYKEYITKLGSKKDLLITLFNNLENGFKEKAEIFKNLFNSILSGEKRYQPFYSLNALERVNLQIDRKLDQYMIDIQKIDSMENAIIDNTLSYLKNVYDEMNSIDRNSAIEIEGKRCKMLIITMPDKDQLETASLKEYIKNTIRNCISLYKQGKSMEALLNNEISSYDLFDRLVSVNKININLIKIEPNRLKKITWKQVIEENSGGEKFVSAFVVFISLLTYMRGENSFGNINESKVLIMDNPFGPITSEHLLKPLFEISKKYNTQMICLTDLKEHTIFDRFNLIYSINIEKEIGREDEYIEVKTIKKEIAADEDEILTASMFRIEDKSRFELVN